MCISPGATYWCQFEFLIGKRTIQFQKEVGHENPPETWAGLKRSTCMYYMDQYEERTRSVLQHAEEKCFGYNTLQIRIKIGK